MVKASGIPTPTFNLLFPKTIDLMTASDEEITGYLELAMSRVQKLGGDLAVFGSGKSRNRPENMSYGEAFRRLVHVAQLTAEVAGRYGVTIAMEPLNRSETNTINSLAEGACLVAAADHPNLTLLADYFHIAKDGEPVSDVVRLGGVAHVHIAAGTRYYPTEADDGIVSFVKALKTVGYDDRMSLEGKSDDPDTDGPAAAAFLKRLWAES